MCLIILVHVLDHTGALITSFHINSPQVEQATWSPDGTMIAFTSDGDETVPLYVYHVEQQKCRHVGDVWNDWRQGAGPFVWSPDSTRIAYIGVDIDEDDGWRTASLEVVNIDDTERRKLALLNPDDDTEEMWPIAPAWSPDGTELLYTSVVEDECHLYCQSIMSQTPRDVLPANYPIALIQEIRWKE